jgi:redox-sensitive bicupin YhaK (pirin superfamily)
MTAASGIVHQEYHGEEFARRGGRFEMVQLWVNLPAAQKMSRPGYQSISDAQIPQVELPDHSGTVRVIAGEFGGVAGPARTHTRINLWDVRLNAGRRTTLSVRDGDTAAVFVLSGRVTVADDEEVEEAGLAVLTRKSDRFEVNALADSTLLVLSGEPIDEPIVGYGPFVMNSQAEIVQAIQDYQSGKMGQITEPAGSTTR